ncbi:motile sperm domain-containing protein 2-like isoform X2 [Bacillus rossius redtenbacheri]|uniref:motile sperm domain-containing protein 2-like isoform X2 n=1 Tax=Bacillus rossius redtenbacheri TaxID=93214 RepID=UPI002FDD0379
MEPSSELIQELRTKFFQKLENDGAPDPGGFHPADLARAKNSDDWLRRFLMHHECNVNEALQMLWECVEWRKKFGTNEITENNIRMDYVNEGSLFVHNRDKDGSNLLIFKSKKHVKGQKDMDELKRVVVYWFERLERLDNGKPISLFFDMSDTGMSNMDMEFIKYLIGLFSQYYPYFLSYIIIFDMPWILNAAFKIIKTWLPAKAVQKIKFLNKTTLKEYVEPDQALRCWGGNDDYVFTFVPEQLALPVDRADDSRKKVHFADGSPMTESFPGGFSEGQLSKDSSQSGNSSLSIVPPDVINFANQGAELTGTISLTNTAETIISYKIKTTSPEKFRVRPSTGTLAPGRSVSINVVLQPGYQLPALSRDKFLIMSLPVESQDMTPQEVTDLWKTNGKTLEQHRLRCSVGGATGDGQLRNGTAFISQPHLDTDKQIAQILSQVRQLNENHQSLHADLRRTQTLQWLSMFLIAMVGFVIIYTTGDSDPNADKSSCLLP